MNYILFKKKLLICGCFKRKLTKIYLYVPIEIICYHLITFPTFIDTFSFYIVLRLYGKQLTLLYDPKITMKEENKIFESTKGNE